MSTLNQLILNFNFDQNFKDLDFYVSRSNKFAFDLINSWPKWEKKFLGLSGEKFSGKTHLTKIFLEKFKGIRLNSNLINNETFQEIKIHQNIVLENLNLTVNEELLYSLLNSIEQDNKYLIITSEKPIVDINFRLADLKSRLKNFLLINIDKPDDELLFALIIKNLSDRQISIDKKLVNFIVKRIERSYGNIHEFIYKIDQISLKRKKSIDFKIIKEVLGD